MLKVEMANARKCDEGEGYSALVLLTYDLFLRTVTSSHSAIARWGSGENAASRPCNL